MGDRQETKKQTNKGINVARKCVTIIQWLYNMYKSFSLQQAKPSDTPWHSRTGSNQVQRV